MEDMCNATQTKPTKPKHPGHCPLDTDQKPTLGIPWALRPGTTTKGQALPQMLGCKVFSTQLAQQALLLNSGNSGGTDR